MSTSAPAGRRSVLGSKDRVKTAVAAAVGTSVENYDFIAYGTASALYFGAVFFPESDRFVGTLLSFATLAVGFLMRPLGGAVGGYFADKFGRKPVLVTAMLVMGAATFLIGVLPTYAQVGVLAPILLVLIRMVQGLAFGAEWGGAVTMAYEHAPWHRRGMYAAIPQAGNPLGIALSSGVFFFSANLDGDWQWRMPFLSAPSWSSSRLIVRAKLSESPEFQEAKATGKTEKNPLLTVLRRRLARHPAGHRAAHRRVLRLLLHRDLPAQLHQRPAPRRPLRRARRHHGREHPRHRRHLPRRRLTDRIGRRPIYIAACVTAIAFGFPMYLLTNGGNPVLVVAVFIFGIGVIHASLTGTQGSLLTEQFRTSTRTSGASFGYQVAASIGGFAPLLAAALVGAFGWPGAALLYVGAAVIGLVGILATRETWGRERAGARVAARG